MRDLISTFRAYLILERDRSQNTVRQYVSVIERLDTYLAVEHGGLAAEAAKKTELVSFLRSDAGSGEAPSRSTWNNAVSAIRAFYEFLVKYEHVKEDPSERIERFKVKRSERLPLSLTEAIALVGVAREYSALAYQSR